MRVHVLCGSVFPHIYHITLRMDYLDQQEQNWGERLVPNGSGSELSNLMALGKADKIGQPKLTHADQWYFNNLSYV